MSIPCSGVTERAKNDSRVNVKGFIKQSKKIILLLDVASGRALMKQCVRSYKHYFHSEVGSG